MWSLSDFTVRSCCAHMNSQFYHTELTAWYHYLISLWDHGELAWTQCFITLDSQFEIIIWAHCEIMLYSHELTAFSHWTHGMISLSDLTVRSWWAHMKLNVLSHWTHSLISLWDHAVLIWTHSFIIPDKRYEIMICSHCEIMVHNLASALALRAPLVRLAEAALTASVESAVTGWPVHRCANVSPALSRHWRHAGGRANTSSVASHHDTLSLTKVSPRWWVSDTNSQTLSGIHNNTYQ